MANLSDDTSYFLASCKSAVLQFCFAAVLIGGWGAVAADSGAAAVERVVTSGPNLKLNLTSDKFSVASRSHDASRVSL